MKRSANLGSWALALYSSKPYPEADADKLVNVVRVALQLMLDGTAEAVHFMRCGCAINVAAVRAEQIGSNEEAMKSIWEAAEALTDAEGIHARHGKYGLTGPGRGRLAAGIDTYEAILRASSPRQMHLAEKELMRRLNQRERQMA